MRLKAGEMWEVKGSWLALLPSALLSASPGLLLLSVSGSPLISVIRGEGEAAVLPADDVLASFSFLLSSFSTTASACRFPLPLSSSFTLRGVSLGLRASAVATAVLVFFTPGLVICMHAGGLSCPLRALMSSAGMRLASGCHSRGSSECSNDQASSVCSCICFATTRKWGGGTRGVGGEGEEGRRTVGMFPRFAPRDRLEEEGCQMEGGKGHRSTREKRKIWQTCDERDAYFESHHIYRAVLCGGAVNCDTVTARIARRRHSKLSVVNFGDLPNPVLWSSQEKSNNLLTKSLNLYAWHDQPVTHGRGRPPGQLCRTPTLLHA